MNVTRSDRARLAAVAAAWVLLGPLAARGAGQAEIAELPADVLADKIRGGLLGEILGNLNGLPYEMKFLAAPGDVTDYVPSLPRGAWSDDDTDFEWVYVYTMQRENALLLSPERIARLWKERINRRIWCANNYARQLMDLGLTPPLTGDVAINPWAEFNISGQFLCEAYGLIAPGMPQTAARIGLNYTRAAIDGEPAQQTQLFTAMIATAFFTDDLEAILDAGEAATDPRSEVRRVVRDMRAWSRRRPSDWRAARRLLLERYAEIDGEAIRDRNGYELNTGSVIGALLYGEGDLVRTLQTAFNFGWDADCNAATAGAVLGVIRGYRWIMSQGWTIVDRYENRTRDHMPTDETITSYADRLIELAERTIRQGGGERAIAAGRPVFRIVREPPGNVQTLPDAAEHAARLQSRLADQIARSVLGGVSREQRARGAYLAIALDLAPRLRRDHPEAWAAAVQALASYENVVQTLYHFSDTPAGRRLQAKAAAAGLPRPAQRKRPW